VLFTEVHTFYVGYRPFFKLAATPPRPALLLRPTQFLLRRRRGLRTCIPALEGTLLSHVPRRHIRCSADSTGRLKKKVNGRDIHVTGRGGLQGCDTSRLPHFLDNREVSLTRRPPFSPQEDSWYPFLLETESTPGP
jgi:hypothetical protein